MKAFAICFITLIAMSNATSMLERYPSMFSFSQKRSIMYVMAQVEATIKNGGPLDAITRVLDEYDNEIRAEQLAHDQLYERQTRECQDEFEFRIGEISEGKAALAEATETLEGCKNQLARAREDLKITKKQIKEKTAELLNIHQVRTREKYAFDTSQGVYAILHPAIAEALDFLEQLFSGEASFLQIARHSNKILVNAAQLGSAHHMAGILSALSQLAQSDIVADQALLEKLQNLFINFRTKLEQENAAAIVAEEAAIKKYNEDVERVTTIINNLNAQQKDLEAEIEQLGKCIAVQSSIITQANAKIERNQGLYDDAIAMCAAMDKQYESAKAGRLAELDLLGAIKVKVEEHFAKLAAGVVERGKLDNFDDTYENASAYEEKSFA